MQMPYGLIILRSHFGILIGEQTLCDVNSFLLGEPNPITNRPAPQEKCEKFWTLPQAPTGPTKPCTLEVSPRSEQRTQQESCVSPGGTRSFRF
jgi:hypothetical protein